MLLPSFLARTSWNYDGVFARAGNRVTVEIVTRSLVVGVDLHRHQSHRNYNSNTVACEASFTILVAVI